MAVFSRAFKKMIENEGGFKLHKISGDKGGQTFAGIARNRHPNWSGWKLIDQNAPKNYDLKRQVQNFYKLNYWNKIKGRRIVNQKVADSIFDFAVNTGVKTASKLAQKIIGAKTDGIIGPKTLGKLSEMEAEEFILKYTLEKISYYAKIVNRNRSQSKFLLGWINRTIKGFE